MHYEPIDVIKHRKFVIPFRRDSFIVSFGTDDDFGSEGDYLNWLQINSEQFPDGFVLVIEGNNPIGQLELTIREYKGNRIGYVNLYYLIPEKRGTGVGKKLHEYALDFFERNKINEYHLRVSPNNVQAIAFYEKNGMQKLETELDGKVVRMRGILL